MSEVMTRDEMLKEIGRLKAEAANLQQSVPRAVSIKVSQKGAVSVYGLGRFPVTLYAGQWTRLLAEAETIGKFIEANKSSLATKE